LIEKDSLAKNSVYRVSKDYRAAMGVVKLYPGSKPAPRRSNNAEARMNIRFVWALQGHASRFSDGSWPVLYTAQMQKTACAEVGYHLQEVYLPAKLPGVDISSPHIVYKLRVRGMRRSLSFDEAHFPVLCGTGAVEMAACHNIARQAISEGVAYLLAPSARAIGKRCYPILSEKVASKPFDADTVELVVWDDVRTVLVKGKGRQSVIEISRKYK